MSKDSRRLAVIIPCYNKVFYTQKTIDSLISCTHSDLHLIVVDDNSTDETFTYIMEVGDKLNIANKQRLWYHKNTENIGVNPSWNAGLRIAMAMNIDHICIANNDLLFTDGWDVPILDALDKEGYWVCSPMSTEQKLPADWPAGRDRHKNPVQSMSILGACFVFKPELIRVIGYFPEAMKFYFGDNWIQDQTRLREMKVGHIQESYIHHFFCQTTKGLDNHKWLRQDGDAYNEYCMKFKLEAVKE